MKKRIPFLLLIITMLISGFAFVPQAMAVIELMNGDLRLDGFVKEYMFIRTTIPAHESQFHGSNLDQALTNALIEGLWKIKEDSCQTVNFFGGLRYWYEAASHFDYKLNSAMPDHEVSRYQHPVNEKDIITESYLDYIRGPWNIRIGKQIVVWGETDIKRTVDVVNPLDLRYGSPGVFSWSELKNGLWMIRGFYQSQLPGNLLFEFIYNPGYFQGLRLPVEGTHWGPSPYYTNPITRKEFGIYNWTVTRKWKHDAPPKWSIDNWELGFRLRGFSYNVDWTLVYYNSLNDGPVVTDVAALNEYLGAWVTAANRSKDTGQPIGQIIKDPGVRAYNYKRYQLFGGTMQTTFDALHGSVWRLEYFYEYGAPYNLGTGGDTSKIYGKNIKRDTFGFGLNYGDKFDIPYITQKWFNGQYFQVSLTAFYEKILNNSPDLIVTDSRDHRRGASHASSISWNLMQLWNNSIYAFVFTGSWAPEINKGFIAPVFAYVPGQHWRWEGGPVIYWSGYAKNRGYYDKDSILIRIRYEF